MLWLRAPADVWVVFGPSVWLGQGSTHHPADPALPACLLGVDARKLLTGVEAGPPVLRDGILLGSPFESPVTLSVRVYAQPLGALVFHLRLRDGRHEVDLIIVEHPDGAVVRVEVVIEDDDVEHLHLLADKLGDPLPSAGLPIQDHHGRSDRLDSR